MLFLLTLRPTPCSCLPEALDGATCQQARPRRSLFLLFPRINTMTSQPTIPTTAKEYRLSCTQDSEPLKLSLVDTDVPTPVRPFSLPLPFEDLNER